MQIQLSVFDVFPIMVLKINGRFSDRVVVKSPLRIVEIIQFSCSAFGINFGEKD